MELRDLSHHRPIIWSKNPECDYVLSITPIMDLGVRHPILRRVHFAKKEVHPCDDLSLDPKGDGDITAPAHVVCGGSTPCHAMPCYAMVCFAMRAARHQQFVLQLRRTTTTKTTTTTTDTRSTRLTAAAADGRGKRGRGRPKKKHIERTIKHSSSIQ